MDAVATLQLGLAPALASALLHALWQLALLAGAAWLVLASMARSSASARHAVAMGFLIAMVAAPALTFLRFWQEPFWQGPGLGIDATWMQAFTAPRQEAVDGGFVQESNPVAALFAIAWLAGVGLMLLRRFGGWRMVSSLERLPYQPLPADWQRRVDALRASLRIGRDVAVRLSADVVAPFTARLLRPVVWLPLTLLTQLPREQVEALIAHELAHVARMDWLWNGLQCVIEALLFFHPAVWWLGRRIRQEREHACDDLAVAACGNAIALAEALVTLERGRHSIPQLVLAAQGGTLMQRITRLLTSPTPPGRSRTLAVLGVVLTAGALFAVQVFASGNWKPDLVVQASTDGALGPGDYREVSAHGVDGDRYYRASVDAQGKLTEVYMKDRQRRPIDAGVRGWLAEVDRMSVVPPPPPPPLPPHPPLPPGVPAPPPPPDIANQPEFKSLMRLVTADPRVVARLGTPVVRASDQINGNISISTDDASGSDGQADLDFELTGPKGRAKVYVDATLVDGKWSMKPVEIADAR